MSTLATVKSYACSTRSNAMMSEYMARASDSMTGITTFEYNSDFSAVAEAIALPDVPIPNPAPKAPPPIAKPAANIRKAEFAAAVASVELAIVGSLNTARRATTGHCPNCRFMIRREGEPCAFIKLAKPLDPVKPQILNENN